MKKIAAINNFELTVAMIFAFVLFVFFLVILVYFTFQFVDYKQELVFIRQNTRVVNGIVLEVRIVYSSGRGRSLRHYPTVQYVDYNDNIHVFESKYSRACKEGDKVTVIYAKDYPKIAKIDGAGDLLFHPLNFTIIISAFIFSSFLLFCMIRRKLV